MVTSPFSAVNWPLPSRLTPPELPPPIDGSSASAGNARHRARTKMIIRIPFFISINALLLLAIKLLPGILHIPINRKADWKVPLTSTLISEISRPRISRKSSGISLVVFRSWVRMPFPLYESSPCSLPVCSGSPFKLFGGKRGDTGKSNCQRPASAR